MKLRHTDESNYRTKGIIQTLRNAVFGENFPLAPPLVTVEIFDPKFLSTLRNGITETPSPPPPDFHNGS